MSTFVRDPHRVHKVRCEAKSSLGDPAGNCSTNRGLPDVAYLEHIGSAFFLDDPTVSEPYEIAMSRLAVAAGHPGDTPQTLTEALTAIGRD
jgi:hypothetical protein